MNFFYRVGAICMFAVYLIGTIGGLSLNPAFLVVGWLMLILAEICDLKEIIKNERINKSYYNRDCRSDKQSSKEY